MCIYMYVYFIDMPVPHGANVKVRELPPELKSFFTMKKISFWPRDQIQLIILAVSIYTC